MINIRRKEYYTMPSVENYYYNDSILKEPPKEVYSIKQDKVNEGGEMTQWFGTDDYTQKLTDYVLKYDKNSNPAVSVDYTFGTYSKQSNKSGNNKSPYVINRDGDVRDPILTYLERYPLNRTYNNYGDITPIAEPNFAKYIKQKDCSGDNIDMVKKLKKEKNIRVVSTKKADGKFKSPYQNCINPSNLYDKYIVDRAEAIVNSKLKAYTRNKITPDVDIADYLKDEQNVYARTLREGNKNYHTDHTIDEAYLKEEKNVYANTLREGNKNYHSNYHIIDDSYLKDQLDVMTVQNGKGPVKRTEINIDELQLKDILDVKVMSQMKDAKRYKEEINIDKEFKNRFPEVHVQSKENILRKDINSDMLRQTVFDMKEANDINVHHPATFKAKYEKYDTMNIKINEQDKVNIYNTFK
jgi:hypothetical protein